MRATQDDDGEYGDVIAFVFGTDDRQCHANCAVPKKQRTEYAAGGCTPARNENGNPCRQPKSGQSCQNAAARGRLPRPSGNGSQQKGNDDESGIAPDHLMGVPIKIGQLGRTRIAEAPKQDGECAV